MIFFLYLYPLRPNPFISHIFFFNFTLTPSFLKQLSVLNTSSDFKRFIDFDFPFACEAYKAHRIDKLLSPSISKILLNGLIVLFILLNIKFLN